ncbi:hypothetical protein [Kingella potus]|uniref:hypothetical protein n=1 Tax=Kingella potus TaxID=265175 RepID=UPI001FD0F0AB|nr:hypothetical protein [Kingella potus]UOP01317.1 hypothetical protein LVJ84_03455 [Kingella potus]
MQRPSERPTRFQTALISRKSGARAWQSHTPYDVEQAVAYRVGCVAAATHAV